MQVYIWWLTAANRCSTLLLDTITADTVGHLSIKSADCYNRDMALPTVLEHLTQWCQVIQRHTYVDWVLWISPRHCSSAVRHHCGQCRRAPAVDTRWQWHHRRSVAVARCRQPMSSRCSVAVSRHWPTELPHSAGRNDPPLGRSMPRDLSIHGGMSRR